MMKRGVAVLGAVLLALTVIAIAALVGFGIPNHAAGMAAKSICSAAFVALRPLPNLFADEVLPASPVLGAIGISVDTANKSVTARFAGLFPRQARLLPDRGCVLDMALADAPPPAPEPGTLLPAAAPNVAQLWPLGDTPLAVADWGAGVDALAMQQLVQNAFIGAGDPQAANTRGLAVVHRGRLLVLRTAPGFDPSTRLHGWSMAKTVLGMLTWKLAAETRLDFESPVVDVFAKERAPKWVAVWRTDARKDIKVSDLLYMRDGLDSTEDYNPWGSVPRMLWGHADAAAFSASSKAEAASGQRWRYLSQTANLLAAVDRTRFSTDAAYWAYPAKALFTPIGARSAVMETDTAGNWVGSSYVWASVGDWARLGQLMLADGRWGAQQVLPPGWLQFASTRSTPEGAGRSYGAHTDRIGDPAEGSCRTYGLPPDTVAMIGHWGQMVAMVPSRELVVVRLGWTFRRGQFDGCAMVAAALKALPG